jgi:hypothetical protein
LHTSQLKCANSALQIQLNTTIDEGNEFMYRVINGNQTQYRSRNSLRKLRRLISAIATSAESNGKIGGFAGLQLTV